MVHRTFPTSPSFFTRHSFCTTCINTRRSVVTRRKYFSLYSSQKQKPHKNNVKKRKKKEVKYKREKKVGEEK